jgi:hypothetical protein
LPKGILTKLLDNSKLVRALADWLKTQEVITMQDLRLPKFDKNRRINRQQVLVFNNNNVKYNIILGSKLSFWNRNQIESLRRKDEMVWLLHSSLSTWWFELKRVQCCGRYVL